MSRLRRQEEKLGKRFPRVSGDEPVPVVTWGAWDAFSPREWG